jgi:hypothetical protein
MGAVGAEVIFAPAFDAENNMKRKLVWNIKIVRLSLVSQNI